MTIEERLDNVEGKLARLELFVGLSRIIPEYNPKKCTWCDGTGKVSCDLCDGTGTEE